MTVSSRFFWYVFGAILVLILIAKGLTLWTDYLWFGVMGQAAVFTTVLWTRIKLGVVVGVVFFVWFWLNLRHARKPLPSDVTLIGKRLLPEEERRQIEQYADSALLVFALIGGLMAGLVGSGKWLPWLQMTHATPFGEVDPLFHQDAGFYVFKLAFLKYVYSSVFYAVIAAAVGATLVHLYQEAIRVVGNTIQTTPRARAHIYLLVALALVVKIFGYRLDQLSLVLANRGAVFYGASYADVYGRLPVMYALMALCLAGAVVIVLSIRSRRLFWPAGALAVIIVFSLLGGAAYPSLVQRLVVGPTQLQLERPFIEHNIAATNRAFGLDKIRNSLHQVGEDLTWTDIQANRTTVDNIRLWDHRPLEKTLDQIQALRAYYDFPDVDVDRYTANGQYRQVMLAPRQIDSNMIKPQTWVKTHLQYTHGYGVVASPVNEVARGASGEGLPNFWVRDIPPQSTPGMEVTRPGVYYYASIHPRLIEVIQSIRRHERGGQPEPPPQDPSGGGGGGGQGGPQGPPASPESRPGSEIQKVMDEPLAKIEDYVVVDTKEAELDYPRLQSQTGDNATTHYQGLGGVPVGSFWRRLAFCVRFYDLQLLLTQSVTRTSKVMINRTLPERTQALCPFFMICDPDPYVTVIDGKLKWINDAYTYSRMYPYSAPHRTVGVNYLRNSVKVVCDAYDGIPEFYVVDPSDPLIKCYQSIFPTLFKTTPMPPEVRKHIRYPQLQFIVQAEMYADYHMLNPDTFYQREDSWSIAQEVYGTEPRMTEAYYVIMKLPGSDKEEFLLMVPLTLRGREDRNMVAWMAARCDADHYGELVCFKMPKDQWVEGPMQIESRIGQDPDFSVKQTLWSQKGSTIIRGNLLVIPIAKSLLYVEPVYLAAANSAIPELKLVVLVSGKKVALGSDLDHALASMFGKSAEATQAAPANATSAPVAAAAAPTLVAPEIKALIDRAVELETRKQQALAGGNLGEYQNLDRQQAQVIQQLKAAVK